MKHTVKEIKLNNGAKGLFIHVPDAQVMTFDFNFRAGEYLIDQEKYEVPHLMEHILLGANKLIPKARDFQAELEKNGAYSNATTGVYEVNYEAECADFEWDRVLGLFLTAISQPLFLKEEFEAEYGNVVEELNSRANNHNRRLSIELRKKFGFVAKTDRERLKLMSNIQLEDVQAHYKKTHKTSNMRFCVAGNITADREKLLKDMIGQLDMPIGDGRIELPDESPLKFDQPLVIADDSVKNIYFYLDTFVLRYISDPESDALSLLNTMFTETLHSKILGAAREKGLVYSVMSGVSLAKDNSNWWIGAQVVPENAVALFEIIKQEIAKVAKGEISDEEIEAAKQYSLGRFQRSAQTVRSTASGYSYNYFFDDTINDYYKMPERIAAITKQSVVKITSEIIDTNVWGLGLLGQCSPDLAAQLNEQIGQIWSTN